MPSIPNLNFIKPLIQLISSTNWKLALVLSNNFQMKIDNKKLANDVNIAIYLALLSVLDLLKKINNEPTKGKKINADSIGKFILF